MGALAGASLTIVLVVAGFFSLYALGGFIIVQPRTQVVVLRWGHYVKTLQEEGINYVFPLGRQIYRLSAQVMTTELPRMIVVEANGNPIEVSAMCTFRVVEAKKAALDVENHGQFVMSLATVTVKNVCAHYPYESPDPQQACLKKESDEIRKHLVTELQELVASAGIEILEMRLNDLAYTPEIAQSMLLRQQAIAMVDARRTLVEGATQTVQGALTRMQSVGITMPPEVIENFSSNLLLVLCSGERVQTVMPIEVRSLGGSSLSSASTMGGTSTPAAATITMNTAKEQALWARH